MSTTVKSSISTDNTHLLYNALIWQTWQTSNHQSSTGTESVISPPRDVSWMLFDTVSGYILDTGHSEPPLASIPESRRTDGGGRRVLPGLHDAHAHVTKFGQSLLAVDLVGCSSVDELRQRVQRFAAEHTTRRWIVGRGWEQDRLGRYPNRHDLDLACPDRPVYLVRVCGHLAVANTRALQLAGIDKNTPDPAGGAIERDVTDPAAPGQPTGLLVENTLKLINPLVSPSDDELRECIELSLQTMLRHGVTSVCACESNYWSTYCRLADQSRLPIRVFYSAYYDESRWSRDGSFPPEAGARSGEMLSCERVKLFADGALGVSTAALTLPYCTESHNTGMLLLSQEELTSKVLEATSRGFRVEIHVIGDRAVDVALTSLSQARVAPQKRPVFVHCQVLRRDQIERMRQAGVIASIQPQFVPTDARWLAKLLQPQLIECSYSWKTLLDSGIVCAGGSDAPIESPQPLFGIYDAIYRPAGNRPCQRQFKPEECLSVREAIDLYTVGAAYAVGQEGRLGQLLPGYQADFILIDTDVCSEPSKLLTAQILQVWVAGQRRL